MVKKHFTVKHPLYKILNPRCLKISYCCLPNVKMEITSYNNRILTTADAEEPRLCNCRVKEACPLDGQCLRENIVYMAEIKAHKDQKQTRTYIGSAGNSFKERYAGHKSSLTHKSNRESTSLSQWYWNEIEKKEKEDKEKEEKEKQEKKKKKNKEDKEAKKSRGNTPKRKEEINLPEIKWTILQQTRAKYSLKNGCTLCNLERLEISRGNKDKLLNKRNELKRACPHYKKRFF